MSEGGEIVRFEAPLNVTAPGSASANTYHGLPMVELPDDNRTGGDFAAELGKHLGKQPIFRREKILLTLNSRGERLEAVGDHEMRTLVERYVCLFRARVPKKTGEHLLRVRTTLGVDLARMVMSSPQLLTEIREIEHLHDIPLPVLRADGKIEIMAEGYDSASRTLTLRSCDYAARPCENGAAYLRTLLKEFQFTEPERSLAVAVAAIMTLFARRILPKHAFRPAFIFTANAPGGGKTLLADCAIAPIFGRSPRTVFPRREEELEKLLLAEVLSGSECLLFDNVRGRVESGAIENLLTSHIFGARILSQTKKLECDNHLTLFFTGNGLTVTGDLDRRGLFVELFQPEARAQDRKFVNPLSVGMLIEKRAEILAALWQMIQAWDRAGRPPGSKTQSGLHEWAATIGGIVEHAGFLSPVTAPTLLEGGNQDGGDMLTLVRVMRENHAERPIDFEKLAELAAVGGLFERITDGHTANGMERADKARFGKLLASYHQRMFGDERITFLVEGRGHGRRFRVKQPVAAASAENPF